MQLKKVEHLPRPWLQFPVPKRGKKKKKARRAQLEDLRSNHKEALRPLATQVSTLHGERTNVELFPRP
jgi:hypothetical protein